MKAVVERLTQSAHYTSARAFFEGDRPLFTLLCALEVRAAVRVNIGLIHGLWYNSLI